MSKDGISRRMTAHYAVIQVVLNSACAVIFGYSSVYLRAQGLKDSQIGLVLAMGTLINIISQPFMGSLADRARKLSLNRLIALFYLLAMAVALVLAPGMVPMGVAAGLFVVLNFSLCISETFTSSLAMEQVNRGINLNFGLARGIGAAGYAISSLLLGKVVAQKGEGAIMPFLVFFCVLCILVLLPFGQGIRKEETTEKKSLDLLGFIRENRQFCLFVAGVALMYFCFSVRGNYMYQIVLAVGGDVAQYGTITAFTAFVELPAMASYPLLSKKFKARSILLFAAGCFVVRSVIIGLAPNMFWIYVSQSMQMISYALFVPASVYYVNEMIGESNRNKGQTFLGMGTSVSSICAAIFGGMMLTAAGGNPQKMLLTSAAVSTLGVALMWFVMPKEKEQ